MSAAPLDRALVLQTQARVPDGAGGYVESWVALGTLWGSLDARSGRFENGETGVKAVTDYRITVRAAPMGQSDRPLAGQRLTLGNRVFRIDAVTEDTPRARYLVCHCQEEATP